jgi:hypothetical protein
MAYYGCGCLVDNRSFVLPCVLNLYFASSCLLWMKVLRNKSYLFFQTWTEKSLSCTDYEIITKTIGNIVSTPGAHIVKGFIIMV